MLSKRELTIEFSKLKYSEKCRVVKELELECDSLATKNIIDATHDIFMEIRQKYMWTELEKAMFYE